MGRYYGMDRVKNWKLTSEAYDCIVGCKGKKAATIEECVKAEYESGKTPDGTPMTYGDVFKENEYEFSCYNFEVADIELYRRKFDEYEAEVAACLERKLPLPAYDCVMKCSHAFNILDARGAISATERANYILRVREVAKACCVAYLELVAAKDKEVA